MLVQSDFSFLGTKVEITRRPVGREYIGTETIWCMWEVKEKLYKKETCQTHKSHDCKSLTNLPSLYGTELCGELITCPKGVLPTVVCRSVCSRNLKKEDDIASVGGRGVQRNKKKMEKCWTDMKIG